MIYGMVALAAMGKPVDFEKYARECLDAVAATADDYDSYINDSEELEEAAAKAFGDNWYDSKDVIEAIDFVIRSAKIRDITLEDDTCGGMASGTPYFYISFDITEEQVMEQAGKILPVQEESRYPQGLENITDKRFRSLVKKLFAEGDWAINDFLGYDLFDYDPSWEDTPEIDAQTILDAIDEACAQMPDDVLESYYKEYGIGAPEEEQGEEFDRE